MVLTRSQILQSRRKGSYMIYHLSLVIDVIRYLVAFVLYPWEQCLAGIATVSLCPPWHSSCCRLKTTNGSSKENVAATSRRWLRDICWSSPDHRPRSLVMEIATTRSWSSGTASTRATYTVMLFCFPVQNFTATEQSTAELWPKSIFLNGDHHLAVIEIQICCCVPNFIKIRWNMAISRFSRWRMGSLSTWILWVQIQLWVLWKAHVGLHIGRQ